jgi:uncharacterized protein YjbI with pentapeptide repeats
MGSSMMRRTAAFALLGSLVWLGATTSTAAAAHSCTPRARADLAGCNFSNKNLTGKNLSGADLKSAKFTHATLVRTKFVGANLTAATLTGAKITDAQFSRATLVHLVSGSLVGKPTSLPQHWQLSQGYLVGPDANLVGANLANAKLRDADLEGANFGAVVAPCIGTICAQYEGLITAVLSNANLSGANLTDANLSVADLAGADLTGAKVTGAELYDVTATPPRSFVYPWVGVTNLADVRSGSIVGVPAELPTGWQLIGGYLVGPGVDLADAHLGSANFTTTASLAPMEWAWSNEYPADVPTDFGRISGYVIGPGTDFASAMLADADFMDVDLVGANLTNADLSGANMTGVDTDNTTTCPNGAAGPCTF